ncbi:MULTISPECIES: flagellar transcriptional regulator FlhD [unclassified Paraburkholderia]|uniref:flagellar transcriptional regulator FlhD n=1 Tax=unclassified Paraburkholderia TaxID=2615204 RepID=UPI002AB6C557|nr:MULTISPECIES: flagellar transcriptional regulator FlhD [unclassified Paraburkholderia]
MSDYGTLRAIGEVNLSYILLAQRMLRENRRIGIFRRGISEQVADLLTGLTVEQTLKLAANDHLLCIFNITDHQILGALAERDKRIDIAEGDAAATSATEPVERVAE